MSFYPKNRIIFYCSLIALVFSGTLYSEIMVIHAGTLIDGQSNQAHKKRTIVIEDQLISFSH